MPALTKLPPHIREKSSVFTASLLKEPNGKQAIPHTGQVELMDATSDLIVASCGRRWGKSKSMGWKVVSFASTHEHRQVFIIAPTLDQSRIIFNEVARHFSYAPMKYFVEVQKNNPFPYIKLLNGTEIHARGANSPQFIRGREAHLLILDEAAFFKDKVVHETIMPMMTTTIGEKDSQIILISTPFGQGAFFELANDAIRGDGQFFHFSSLSNPYADKKFLDRQMRRYGADSFVWKTEYLAEFEDDDGAVFSREEIQRAIDQYPYITSGITEDGVEYGGDQIFPVDPMAGHLYTQGVDFANQRDYFVSAILDATDPGLSVLVRYDRFRRRGYTAAKATVRANYGSYFNTRTLADATSLGESVVEDLSDIHVEGFKFSELTKYDLIQELKRTFNEGRIAIPNDRVVINELRYFSYSITPSKRLKIEASKGNDDTVIGIALANRLAVAPRSSVEFAGVLDYTQVKPKAIVVPKAVDPIFGDY